MVVSAFATTNPAKVETQDREARILKCLGDVKQELEVHHAAMERMGMAEQGCRHGLGFRRHENGLESPRRTRDIELLGFRSHDTFKRNRWT